MATLLLLTNAMQPSAEVLPALGLLGHSVRVAPMEISALLDTAPVDAVLVDARLRLAIGKIAVDSPAADPGVVRAGALTIDEGTYTCRLKGKALDLTFKEFELLKYLAQHPGRVFTRAQLLQEVWGYDYYGGTRTVDVHVRRLRAKLGPEHEALIGTVRHVGYKFVTPPIQALSEEESPSPVRG